MKVITHCSHSQICISICVPNRRQYVWGQETTSQENFCNILNDNNCPDEDYCYEQIVLETFKCGTLSDFHNHYLSYDVILTADILHNFPRTSKDKINIDPTGCYASSVLSLLAKLYIT